MRPIRFETPLSRFDYKGGMYYLPVPADLYAKLKRPQPLRLKVSTADGANWKAGLMSMGNGTGFLTASTQLIKKQGWRIGQALQVTLEEDLDEEVFPMSDEMREVFDTDLAAAGLFDSLTPGKQRGLIHFVNTAKSSQVRIERALAIAANLQQYGTKGSLPELTRKTKSM